ncbi:hypothetical protein DEO72_LG2g3903 [Vigna unguiculata]|uniref:Uncharacterized protein n=1 Tax=Vigna unguiculata TaxID=3917 RepID=A0A4D6L4W6_VIGUN|nr:hypothetical protein DEO72_LG2g3903 [Vigna unguiculata]
MPHQLHLQHHLLPCNELHDHRQTQVYRILCDASTYKPQLVDHVRETYYGPHFVTPGGVLNTNHSSYSSQDYQTRWLMLKRAIFLDPSV